MKLQGNHDFSKPQPTDARGSVLVAVDDFGREYRYQPDNGLVKYESVLIDPLLEYSSDYDKQKHIAWLKGGLK